MASAIANSEENEIDDESFTTEDELTAFLNPNIADGSDTEDTISATMASTVANTPENDEENKPDDKDTTLNKAAKYYGRTGTLVSLDSSISNPPFCLDRPTPPFGPSPSVRQVAVPTTTTSTELIPTPPTPFTNPASLKTANGILARFEQEYGTTLDTVLAPSSTGIGRNMDFLEMKERFKISFSDGLETVRGVQRGLRRLLKEQEGETVGEIVQEENLKDDKEEETQRDEGGFNVVGAGVTPFRRMVKFVEGGFRESFKGRRLFNRRESVEEENRITEIEEDEEDSIDGEERSEDSSEEEEEEFAAYSPLRASQSQMVLFVKKTASSLRSTITVDNAKATFQHSMNIIHERNKAFKRLTLWESIIVFPVLGGFLYLTGHKILLHLTPDPPILVRSSGTTYDSNGLPLLTPYRPTPFHFADTPTPPSFLTTTTLTLCRLLLTLFRFLLLTLLTHILPVISLLLLILFTLLHPSLSSAYSGASHSPIRAFYNTRIAPQLTTLLRLLQSSDQIKLAFRTTLLTIAATVFVSIAMMLQPAMWALWWAIKWGSTIWRVTEGERFWWAAAVVYWGALLYGMERVGWDLAMNGVEKVRWGICG